MRQCLNLVIRTCREATDSVSLKTEFVSNSSAPVTRQNVASAVSEVPRDDERKRMGGVGIKYLLYRTDTPVLPFYCRRVLLWRRRVSSFSKGKYEVATHKLHTTDCCADSPLQHNI